MPKKGYSIKRSIHMVPKRSTGMGLRMNKTMRTIKKKYPKEMM